MPISGLTNFLEEFQGDVALAHEFYRKQAELEGEQGWLAMLRLAQLSQDECGLCEKTIHQYLDVYNIRPWRAEALYALAVGFRQDKKYALGKMFASFAMELSFPDRDRQGRVRSLYEYGVSMEYAVCSYFLGDYHDAVTGFNKSLRSRMLPQSLRPQLIDNRRICLDKLFPRIQKSTTGLNRITVISTFRNAGRFVEDCVRSICSQTYKNFSVIMVDDGSTDNCAKAVPKNDNRFRLITYRESRGALYRHISTALELCQPEDIVLRLDGDDQLADSNVLENIDNSFRSRDCWVSYGQFRFSDGRPGTAMPLTRQRDLSSRALLALGFPLHPICYRVALLKALQLREPELPMFKDGDGDWFTASTDLVQVLSLMQAAGIDRIYYNDRVNYIYNINHPNLTSQHNRSMQIKVGQQYLSRRPVTLILDQMFKSALTRDGR